MRKENKNRIGLIVLLIAIVLFAGGITYAFFSAGVTETQEKLTVTTGTMALTFSDNSPGMTLSSLGFGQSTSKRFSIENTGTEDVTTNMLWNNLVNTYTEDSLTYTFESSTSETGPWTAVPNASGNVPRSTSASDKTLAPDIEIPAHQTYYYKLTITLNHLTDIDQTNDKDALLSSNFKLGDKIIEDPVLVTLAKLKAAPKAESPNFAIPATTDEGVYLMEDDYGTSYYYRGAVTNNYVKFAGFYWRIIRVNGDGSLRMIYDGTTAHNNGGGAETFTSTSVDGSKTYTDRFINDGATLSFNRDWSDNAYAGYMHGEIGQSGTDAYTNTHKNINNSLVKITLDNWYKTNIYDKGFDKYVSDEIFCNDRSVPGSTFSGDTGLGYGENLTGYGAFNRFLTTDNKWNMINPSPKFTCTQKNDAFTVDDITKGNGASTYKVGLITVDEAVTAGAAPGNTNQYYYLYKSSNLWYWTISPSYFGESNTRISVYIGGFAYIFNIRNNGGLSDNGFDDGAVVPVINIAPSYAAQLTGNGTTGSPFQIPGVA